MKIQYFDTHNLRNAAHFQFHTEFRDLVFKHDPQTLRIKPLFAEYLPLYDRADEAAVNIAKSEFTAKIKEADRARDKIYSGMNETNAGALKHFNPAVREAAKRLKIVFDTYGNVAKKTLNEETAAISNILQELKGKYAPDAAAAGLTEWAAQLENSNNALEKLVKERFDETAKKSGVALKTARAELDAVYRRIAERVNALIIVEGVDGYETFVKTLNVVIAKYAVKKPARRANTEQRKRRETAGAD